MQVNDYWLYSLIFVSLYCYSHFLFYPFRAVIFTWLTLEQQGGFRKNTDAQAYALGQIQQELGNNDEHLIFFYFDMILA